MASQQYVCQVDATGKATEMPLHRIWGSKERNPHMRAFWLNTLSFFLAFLGWYALAPLGVYVTASLKVCENQLYPPAEFPKRKAYLKYKNVDKQLFYCRYGKNDIKDPTECKDVPATIAQAPLCGANAASASSGVNVSDLGANTSAVACATAQMKNRYNPSVLPKCVCTAGTECKGVIDNAGIAGVASTIFARSIFGSLLERFGPVNVQSGLLLYGSIVVASASLISAPWNFALIRFLIGVVGASFVTCQFWSYLMFSKNIVGTANAVAAGWGNLGGGFAQFFMVKALVEPFINTHGMTDDLAWRVSMLIPAGSYLICAVAIQTLCWDTPNGRRFHISELGKTNSFSVKDYVEVLKDPRALIMIYQYGACFGAELALNNVLPTHFQTYFQMKSGDAALAASSMGLMNFFSRALGGIASDWLNKRFGFRGRIWAQFICLFFEALFLFLLGRCSDERPWWHALLALLAFSLFCEACCGTSYSIVPFVNAKQVAIVSALIAMGGNIGAVLAQWCLYKTMSDVLLPFQVHAAFVLVAALLTPLMYWPEYGGMFRRASVPALEKAAPSEKATEVAPSEKEATV
eukprot:CAMPEP_0183483842 /NCGR_PEP_ID=MMETSP0370-20130417/178613_1 /TAXON_ID=268820 /ORGANISM="Peridinium aciculiferum, Strain PAER-2" /LENGTH=577 /DNA_ID=CAMNT_0025677121 /DNA_START=99 /DNA_END=1832 /DNA_ORIENTATION=-